MTGPGKYDDACSEARKATGAKVCILIVVAGDKGNGFEVQFTDDYSVYPLPAVLREMADQIEKDMASTSS